MVAAGIILGSAVIGAAGSAYAANKAAKAQTSAANAAAGAQLEMYHQTRADLGPYRETGYEALAQLSDMLMPGEGEAPDYSAFYESPGYQFRYDEGLRALDKSAASRGVLQSGGYGRELQRYGQGFASGEFNNYANRLAALAGIGQTATSQTAQLGQATGQGVANNLITAGTARASGYIGASNAINQGLGNAANNYMMYNYLNQGSGPTAAQASYANAYGGDFSAY